MNTQDRQQLINIHKDPQTGIYSYTLTKAGEACHFLRFLINTSSFSHRKENVSKYELIFDTFHLVSKLCAIGYLVLPKNPAHSPKAVLAKNSDISFLQSGKSLFGNFIFNYTPSEYIFFPPLYKYTKDDIDSFLFSFSNIKNETKLFMIDGLPENFKYESLYSMITGDLVINNKYGSITILDFLNSPKLYLTTAGVVNRTELSFTERFWQITFSDFYNKDHLPYNDFGSLWLDMLNDKQKSLNDALVADCIDLYNSLGVVEAPALIKQK